MVDRSEFKVISDFFAPLSNEINGRGLKDDAGLIQGSSHKDIILTADMLVSGVHFKDDMDPYDISRRALRVNLSDVAAMGASPKHYLLSLGINDNVNDFWIDRFSKGLAFDQKKYNLTLIGGDTVNTKGPIVIAVTLIGEIDPKKAIGRNEAKPMHNIYVSGSIGDAFFGLKLLNKEILLSKVYTDQLIDRYKLPDPRLDLGQKLINLASSSLDISDGLVADLEHICTSSKVGATIYLDSVPLSGAASHLILKQPDLITSAITWGDDYEILFTASPDKENLVEKISKDLGLRITKIGFIENGNNIKVIDKTGQAIDIIDKGYRHR